jgi:hypothetical protein
LNITLAASIITGPCVIRLFTDVIYKCLWQDRVFVLDRALNLSQLLWVGPGAYLEWSTLKVLYSDRLQPFSQILGKAGEGAMKFSGIKQS